MQNNLMYFHANNYTKTHLAEFASGVCENTVNAPLGVFRISGPLTADTAVAVHSGNLFDGSLYGSESISGLTMTYDSTNQEFTFNGTLTDSTVVKEVFVNIPLIPGRKYKAISKYSGTILKIDSLISSWNTFYFEYADGTPLVSFQLQGGSGKNFGENISGIAVSSISTATKSSIAKLRMWISIGTVFRNFKVKLMLTDAEELTDFVPYITPHIVNIPYELGENDYIMSENGIVYLYKDSALSDITSGETGAALLAMKGYYPMTVCSGIEAKLRRIGEP